ncbi:MAG: hypothetical protein NPIRA01_09710 [Nitrospirales bacterium]|nr:MAG: hypothetical protein NPIRA01_09710 [Nitrospirales bacterium]
MSKEDSGVQKNDKAAWAQLRAIMMPFLRMLLSHPDIKEAKRLVAEQAKLVWEKFFGAELERLGLEVQAIEGAFAKSSDILASLMDRLGQTNPYIPAAHMYGKGEDQYIPFSRWRSKDKVIVISSLCFALVVLTMSAANVYANILGSGNPIFIDQPFLALIISALLPAGSVAMKFTADIFESDKTRGFYKKSLYVLSVLALLAWTVLFALNFHGLSSEINFDDLEGSNPTSSALTWVQLLAELLVGFVLCHVASDTYSKYAPNAFIRNPEYAEIESAIQEHFPSHDPLREQRNTTRGRQTELKASQSLFVNEIVALYIAMRRRFDESSPT